MTNVERAFRQIHKQGHDGIFADLVLPSCSDQARVDAIETLIQEGRVIRQPEDGLVSVEAMNAESKFQRKLKRRGYIKSQGLPVNGTAHCEVPECHD